MAVTRANRSGARRWVRPWAAVLVGAGAACLLGTAWMAPAGDTVGLYTAMSAMVGESHAAKLAPRPDHPRLWLDSATESRLAASVKAGDSAWHSLKEFCDASDTKPDWDYQGHQRYRYVANFALCYRLAKRAGMGQSTVNRYGAKALVVLTELIEFSNYANDSGYGIRNYLPAIALGYDWLHDYPSLTESLKSKARLRMRGWADWYAQNGYGRANDDKPVPVYLSNYNAGYLVGRMLASIAMYGDEPGSERYFNEAVAHQTAALASFDQYLAGGHWPEGWNYGASAYEFHALAASALRHASGSEGAAPSNWLRENILFKLHALAPNGRFFYDDGAWPGSHLGDPRLADIYVAGSLVGWRSPAGGLASAYVRLARNWNEDGTTADQGTLVGEWRRLLFFDASAPAASLKTVTTSHIARGAGLVLWRSAWNQAGATWGTFIAGPYLAWQDSQDLDQGHMEIYKNAPLLVDAGHKLYGSDQLHATVHHNTFTLEHRRGDAYLEKGIMVTGQRQFGNSPQCSKSRVGIKQYEDAGAWLFVNGDLTDAYRPRPRWGGPCFDAGVARLVRNVFYLRPDLFFVFDQVEKQRDELQVVPHLNFHFPTKPVTANANRELTVNNGGGRLQVITVFPTDADARLAPNKDSGAVVPGWHLAVSAAKQQARYQQYLHVFRATDSGTRFPFPRYGAISGTGTYGVWINSSGSGEATSHTVVVFADDGTGTVPRALEYQISEVPARHYILNLKPSTHYTLDLTEHNGHRIARVREAQNGTLRSSSAGVLVFTH